MLHIYQKVYVLFFIGCLGLSGNSLATFNTNENNENTRLTQQMNDLSISTIKEQWDTIRSKVENAYNNQNLRLLIEAYKDFQQWQNNEHTWQRIAVAGKIKKWSLQKTWKDTVGGQLFFLKDIESQPVVATTVWAHAFSASFNHPIALFHLAVSLFRITSFPYRKERYTFFEALVDKAFPSLYENISDPDVFYAMASSYFLYIASYIDPKDFKEHLNPKDLKSCFAMLKIQEQLKDEPNPSAEAYLSIARAGYLPAYSAAVDSLNNKSDKITVCKEALNQGYDKILIKLADIDSDKYADYLEMAAKANVSDAFIFLGTHIVGDIFYLDSDVFDDGPKKRFVSQPKENYARAHKLFKQAAALHDPRGLVYMGYLAELLCEQEVSLVNFRKRQKEVLIHYLKGCQMGYPEAYRLLSPFSDRWYYCAEKWIAPDSRRDLWAHVQSFIGGNEEEKKVTLQNFKSLDIQSFKDFCLNNFFCESDQETVLDDLKALDKEDFETFCKDIYKIFKEYP
jgi:hypothetical protein